MRIKLPSSEQWLYLANIILSKLAFRPRYDKETKRILIVKLDEIGDMATATNVFALLRRSYPQSEIHVLCKPFVKNLIENDTSIQTILTDVNDWNTRYDLVIELRGSFKTLLKSLRYRPKYRCSRALVRWRNLGKQLHELDTNYETVRNVIVDGIANTNAKLYFSREDEMKVDDYLSANGISRFALIHAGARKKLRQWNKERFAEAVARLKVKHGLDVLFIGSEEEKQDSAYIGSLSGINAYNVCGLFSLSQLSCLISRAGFYLGNESGPLHMAAAFEIPTVALFGPGVPNVFYPRHNKSFVFHPILSCNPCDQIHCVHPDSPCISRIQTSEVLLKMDEILLT